MKSLLKFLLVISTLSFAGCNLEIKESSNLDRPDISTSESGIIISGKYINSKTEYINIYRWDVYGSSPSESDAVNIGIIFPSAFNQKDRTYRYEDIYAIEGRSYRYAARFYAEGNYYLTDWTGTSENGFTIPAGKGISVSDIATPPKPEFLFDTSTSNFIYDKTNYSLKIDTFPTPPAKIPFTSDFSNCLVVQKDDATQIFELEIPDYSVTNFVINLTSLLPTEFFDRDIRILGLIGQKNHYSEETPSKLQYCVWTELTPIELKDTSNNTISKNKIKIITSTAKGGYDYSPYKSE